MTQFALWLGSRWIGQPDQDDRDDPVLWAVWRESSLAAGWAALVFVTAVVSVLLAVSVAQLVPDRLLAGRIIFVGPVFSLVATAVHIFLLATCALAQNRARPFAILNIPSAMLDLVLLAIVAVVWIGIYLAGIAR